MHHPPCFPVCADCAAGVSRDDGFDVDGFDPFPLDPAVLALPLYVCHDCGQPVYREGHAPSHGPRCACPPDLPF